MGQYDEQAARRTLPGPGTALTVGNGASANNDLSALVGQFVTLKFSGKTHVRAGAASQTAVTTDFWLEAGETQDFLVTEAKKNLACYGVGAAHTGVAAPTGE